MADNIRIAVRVRPFAPHEKGQECIIDMNGKTTTIRNPEDDETKDFQFNNCFWSHDNSKGGIFSNKDLMKVVGEEILGNAYSGFNATIFAYGQTGAGKSYSIEGCPSDRGLL